MPIQFDEILRPQCINTDAHVRYTLAGLSIGSTRPPVLLVRFAGEGNAAYMSASLTSINELRARGGGRAKLTEAQIVADREDDAKLFAATVVVGWENVEDNGKPESFSRAEAEKLLLWIVRKRYTMFDELRAFVRSSENFTGSPAGAADALGKP